MCYEFEPGPMKARADWIQEMDGENKLTKAARNAAGFGRVTRRFRGFCFLDLGTEMPGAERTPPRVKFRIELLEFDGCAGFLEFLLGSFGSIRGNTFEDVGRGGFDEFLRIGKSESGSNFTDRLDDGDLVGTGSGDDDVELGFLLSGFGRACCGRTGCDGCCGGDAPGFFELFDEIDSFQDGELAEFFYEVCNI